MRGQEVFVLDTNVLIFAPEALEAFSDAEIVIPINVIEELDRFKAELSDRGCLLYTSPSPRDLG